LVQLQRLIGASAATEADNLAFRRRWGLFL
jgi:hypothetical protein